MFQRDHLIALIKEKAITHGTFTLASGRPSKYYVDMTKVSLTANGISLITQAIAEVWDWGTVDAVGGPALGAVPLVSVLVAAQKVGRGFFVRKEAKAHGDQNLIEGNLRAGDKVVMLEDVVTTGGSFLKAVQAAERAGALIVSLVAVLDREEGASEIFAKLGYPFTPLVLISEIIPSR